MISVTRSNFTKNINNLVPVTAKKVYSRHPRCLTPSLQKGKSTKFCAGIEMEPQTDGTTKYKGVCYGKDNDCYWKTHDCENAEDCRRKYNYNSIKLTSDMGMFAKKPIVDCAERAEPSRSRWEYDAACGRDGTGPMHIVTQSGTGGEVALDDRATCLNMTRGPIDLAANIQVEINGLGDLEAFGENTVLQATRKYIGQHTFEFRNNANAECTIPAFLTLRTDEPIILSPRISSLTNLNHLRIENTNVNVQQADANNAGNTMPFLCAVAQLTQLTHLVLADLKMQNVEIPREFGKLTSLKTLDLHGNDLRGELPSDLKNLTQLTRLELHDNPELKGELPDALMRPLLPFELHISNTNISFDLALTIPPRVQGEDQQASKYQHVLAYNSNLNFKELQIRKNSYKTLSGL